MPENGHYVTRGEFNIVYDDLKEIKADVKTLLAANAAGQAVEGERTKRADRKVIWKPTVYSVTITSLLYLALHFIP